MDKKGQSGTTFIIVLPIIVLVMAFLYDNALMMFSNNKYREVSKSIIKDVLTNSYTDKEKTVKSLYEKNHYETEQLNVEYNGNILSIYNVHYYPSFFGNILGVRTYRVEVSYKATKDADIILIEENKEV